MIDHDALITGHTLLEARSSKLVAKNCKPIIKIHHISPGFESQPEMISVNYSEKIPSYFAIVLKK